MFCHLHLHSQYSILESNITIGDVVSGACRYGMQAAALTDRNVMHGAIEFYCQARAKGDGVAGRGVGDDLAQGARTRVCCGGDGACGGVEGGWCGVEEGAGDEEEDQQGADPARPARRSA